MKAVLRKIKRFFSLSSSTQKILVEAYFFLGWARILKLIPFYRLAPTLGTQMDETPFYDCKRNSETLKKVSSAIYIMSKYTFWESQCLVKAIAGMKMLERRHIESTLYLGTAKEESGKMVAHAWLRSGNYYISGSEGMERFTVVGKFAKKILGD